MVHGPTRTRALSSHHGTRALHSTRTSVGRTVILAVGAAIGLAQLGRPPPTPAASSVTSTRTDQGSGLDPTQTQRKGEWSVTCGTTGEPLLDFSPVDRGRGQNQLILTAHNCSGQAGRATMVVWFGGREGMTDFAQLDPDRTSVTELTLAPWESAKAVVTWEPAPGEEGSVLSVRLPGIGEGQLTDDSLAIRADLASVAVGLAHLSAAGAPTMPSG